LWIKLCGMWENFRRHLGRRNRPKYLQGMEEIVSDVQKTWSLLIMKMKFLLELSIKSKKNTAPEPWVWSYWGWDFFLNLQKNTLAFNGGWNSENHQLCW
jgi:hypothetical protein